jgi:hypothetical protein
VAVGVPSSADNKSAALGSGSPASTAGTAKLGEAKSGEVSALRPLALSAFPRANTYHLYAANGSTKVLRLNFSSAQYEILDALGQSTSGTFAEDASEAGTYVFASSRIAAGTTSARFRVTEGAIVGAFPFEKPWSNPTVYQAVPFVAANNFVTDAASLDGEYNRFGIGLNSNGSTDSQVVPLRISAGGTVLEMCLDAAIYRVSECPAASKRIYAVTRSADGLWTAVSASPVDLLQFRMAKINGENVWLSGGWTDTAPETHAFRVGLRSTADWAAMRYVGAANDQTWGSNTVGFLSATRTGLVSEGAPTADQDLPITPPHSSAPAGIWGLDGTNRFLVMRNAGLAVVLGARGTSQEGYIQLDLFKESASIYRLSATNGARPELRLDMASRSYTLKDPSGETVTGSFAPDSAEPGVFVFSSPRITSVTNTARFKVVGDIITGGFPFAVTQSVTPAFAVQPFVGSRAMEAAPSAIEGVYNRFGIDVSPTASTSNIQQFRIFNNGTELVRCTNNIIYRIELCPASDLEHWTVDLSAATVPGSLKMVETANPSNSTTFSVAQSGGQKIFLIAGKSFNDPNNAVFRIGLSENSDWPTGKGHGLATTGSWGRVQVYADHSTRAVLTPDGATSNTYNPLSPMPANGPSGMRALYGNNGTYFIMQGAKIFALVGANNASTAGYLQLSLMD